MLGLKAAAADRPAANGGAPALLLVSPTLPPLRQRDDAGSSHVAARASGSIVDTFTPAALGRTHFALEVPHDRLQACVDRVRAHGIEVSGPLDYAWMSAEACLCFDPDGHLVELWSPNPASP